MEIKSRLGVHVRMQRSFKDVIERADFLQIPFFQCFFIVQESGRFVIPTDNEIEMFLAARQSRFGNLFCHISYWVNLSSLGNNGYLQLRREIALAKRLQFTHFVLHAGTAKGAIKKEEGIDALAAMLNNLFKKEKEITILLENTCHSNLAIGSDINDFKYLLEKLDQPERIGFCIDTAHAYSYGYDIVNDYEAFIIVLQETIGIERIQLIHLNDTAQYLGAYIDRHVIPGEGVLGVPVLKKFASDVRLHHIPLLMELPEMTAQQELAVLEMIRKW